MRFLLHHGQHQAHACWPFPMMTTKITNRYLTIGAACHLHLTLLQPNKGSHPSQHNSETVLCSWSNPSALSCLLLYILESNKSIASTSALCQEDFWERSLWIYQGDVAPCIICSKLLRALCQRNCCIKELINVSMKKLEQTAVEMAATLNGVATTTMVDYAWSHFSRDKNLEPKKFDLNCSMQ